MQTTDKRSAFGWLACIWASGFFPLLDFYERNAQCFLPRQLVFSALAWLLALAAVWGLTSLAFAAAPKAAGRRFYPLAMAALAVAAYLALSFHSLWKTIHARGLPWPIEALLGLVAFALITAAVRKIGWKKCALVLALAIGLKSAQWGAAAHERARNAGQASIPAAQRTAYAAVRLRSTPDVYFLVLESYHGPAWLRDFYGIENPPFFGELQNLGFQIQSNFFANYLATMASLHAVFTMAHHYYAIDTGDFDSVRTRALIAGADYNPVLSIFKANGYRLEYLLGNHYLCLPEMAAGTVDAMVPEKSGALAPLLSRAWPHGAFDENHMVADYRDRLVARVSRPRPPGPPLFVLAKAGLEHTPRGPHDPARWKQTYRALLEEENGFLLRFCRALVANHPAAIVVLMGDHGAWGYASRWWSKAKDPNAYFHEHGLDPAWVARDMADAFLAIRGGQDPEFAGEVRSPVNLFRELFLRLGADERLLAPRAEDASYKVVADNLYRFVLDGAPLNVWEKVPTESLAAVRRAAPVP